MLCYGSRVFRRREPHLAVSEHESRVLRGHEDLLAPFHAAEKPASEWRVGTEAEKCGVHADGSVVLFEGAAGVRAVMAELEARFGWSPYRETEGGVTIALLRDKASITLEPGAQLELSGAPLRTIHQTRAELDQHLAELAGISDTLGIRWLGLGFHPFATRAELPWVPKLRYGIMREYLPTRGKLAHDMMLRTCTVQANYDYASEADAMRKLRVSLGLSVITTALFANSPFVEKRATGERSHRARVWLEVDPDRSGLLPFAWREDATYESYIAWALDVPMFLVKHGDQLLHNTGQTFRAFMKEGFQGQRATMGDWETHLNTLFPEVRLKKTLEIRGADSAPRELVCALPALWKGLLHDERALAQAEALASQIDFDGAEAARADISARGLRAELKGREVAVWANDLLAIAAGGLERIGDKNEAGDDERIHLRPLMELARAGKTPADALLEKLDLSQDLVPQVLEHARL